MFESFKECMNLFLEETHFNAEQSAEEKIWVFAWSYKNIYFNRFWDFGNLNLTNWIYLG